MADIDFSIAALFDHLFGPSSFEPNFPLVVNGGDDGDGLIRRDTGNMGSPYYAQNALLGREYYLPVTITYPDTTGSSSALTGETNGGVLRKWELPNPVISITSKKTIIETPLTERRGTVKELINIQDYEITIKGKIVNKYNEFPEGQVTIMRSVYELNEPVFISNPITDIFLLRNNRSGSDQVIIKELRFPDVTGVKNVRPYELVLVSDEPFSLIKIV